MIRKLINPVLNIIAAVAAATAFIPMMSWSRLEGVPVPTHFNIHGVADKAGGREILLTLGILAAAAWIIMLLLQCFPRLFTLCAPSWKSEIAKEAGKDLAAQLSLLLTMLFSFGANSTLSVAAGQTQTLAVWFIWAIIALVLLCIAIASLRIYGK